MSGDAPGGNVQGLNFTAIDFETANSKRGSVCAVGLARVRNGVVVDTASWLIKPPHSIGEFAPRNIAVHGIRPEDVQRASSWSTSIERIMAFSGSDAFVAHNASFDRSVFRGACTESGLMTPDADFHCSMALSKRLLGLEVNKLPYVAKTLGVDAFDHHDAGSDAAACAAVVIAIARQHSLPSIDLLWPSTPPSSGSHRYAKASARSAPLLTNTLADRTNGLYGQTIVFTGGLATLTRDEAVERVAASGAIPANNVTKKTTMIVVGHEDATAPSVQLTGASGKERKALEYIEAGQPIRVVGERELRALLGFADPVETFEDKDSDARGLLDVAVSGLLAWIGRRRVK